MRYVCYKTVVAKIIDEQVRDQQEVKALLTVFAQSELTCAIRISHDPTLEKVRILKVGESDFLFQAIRHNANLKKTAKFEDVEYLELKTSDAVIARLKPNTSRWMLLDPDSSLPSEDV